MKHTPRRAARALAILVVAAQHPDTIGAAEAGGAAGMSEGDAIALCADMRQAGLLRRGRGLRLMHHPSKITLEDVVQAVCGQITHVKHPKTLRDLAAVRLQDAMGVGMRCVTLADIMRDAALHLGGDAGTGGKE